MKFGRKQFFLWGDGSESENTFPLPQMKTSESVEVPI
jgi:hypothetical protein